MAGYCSNLWFHALSASLTNMDKAKVSFPFLKDLNLKKWAAEDIFLKQKQTSSPTTDKLDFVHILFSLDRSCVSIKSLITRAELDATFHET